MQISYNWLLEYLPAPIAIDELSSILTSIGLEVETVEKSEVIPGGMEGLVIGQVEHCEKHPNADKLSITTVNIGQPELLHIVCGAPNVASGQKVIVAPVGTTVHPLKGDPFLIKKSKIRGELSEGMICAEDEIGLGSSHEGIMVLPVEAIVGTSAASYFRIPPPDYTIHIGLTPNRSDGNSHIGVARDVCTYMSHHKKDSGAEWQVRFPALGDVQPATTLLPFSVQIEAQDACPRYAGITLKDVQVGPSPEWLVQRLQTIGIRSINNVVDVTNYVLHEYGQPLHAFDYDKLEGHKIIVRYPAEGQKFTGLDEKERTLLPSDLMICDARTELCIAGVFGGLYSGISDQTRNIFLESAYFQPQSIRRTSLHHGLRTDAATHFEKGVDIGMVIPALTRAAILISTITGAQIASGIEDLYPNQWEAPLIKVDYAYINNLCGKNYIAADVDQILTASGFSIRQKNDTYFEVAVPSNKPDIKQPADIAEEILRIDGLDNVPISGRLSYYPGSQSTPTIRTWKEHIADYLTNAGLQEIVTNSITNSKYYPGNPALVHMINSLSSELDIMRPYMLESGLEVIAYNTNRKQQDLQLYEFGDVYHLESPGKYKQTAMLAFWVCGHTSGQHWQHPAVPADIFYIKGLLQNVFQLCGIHKIQESVTDGIVEWKRGKQTIARAYTVPAARKKIFDIKQEVFYAEIDMQSLVDAIQSRIKYAELPKYPSVKRDLALVLDKQVSYNQVAAIAQGQKWEALQHYELFDIFESEKLGMGKKSLALSFTFQLKERTLTDEEVDNMMQQLISLYRKDLQAQIRE